MISIHVTLTCSSCLFPSQPFWPFEEYDSRRHPNCQPHLDYLAPEYALTHTLDTAADLFPLGVLTYALFNEGRPIFHNNQDFGTFKRNCCEVRTVLFLFLFGKLVDFIYVCKGNQMLEKVFGGMA